MGETSLPRGVPLPQLGTDEPAHVQIERWLLGAIGRRELAPGDRLPPEAELAAGIGVSRMTLRQALGRLEGRGVIVRRPGRSGGTFVADPRVDVDLSGWAGFTAALRRNDLRAGTRVLTAATVAASRQVAAALGVPPGEAVYEIVRVRSLLSVPVAVERSWFPARLVPGLLDRSLTGSLYRLLRVHYALEPVYADESIDAVLADADLARRLGVRPGSPLLRVERTAFAEGGVAIECAHDVFRPDRVRLCARSGIPG